MKRKQIEESLSRPDAIDRAVRFWPEWFENDDEPGRKLANFMDGKRGVTRRRTKRARR
jgi:hypothetical protein